MQEWQDEGEEEEEELAGGSGVRQREMIQFVSKTIKWSTLNKERHGEKNLI